MPIGEMLAMRWIGKESWRTCIAYGLLVFVVISILELLFQIVNIIFFNVAVSLVIAFMMAVLFLGRYSASNDLDESMYLSRVVKIAFVGVVLTKVILLILSVLLLLALALVGIMLGELPFYLLKVILIAAGMVGLIILGVTR